MDRGDDSVEAQFAQLEAAGSGVIFGSIGGGMLAGEPFFRVVDTSRAPHYFLPSVFTPHKVNKQLEQYYGQKTTRSA